MKEYMRKILKGFIDLFKCIDAEDIGAGIAITVIVCIFFVTYVGLGILLTTI